MRQGTIPRDPPAGKQGVAPPVTDPVGRLLAGLENVKPSGNGWTAQCPAHEDRNPSLSVAEGQDGKVLLTCHAGCSAEAIVQALGLQMSDLFPEDTPPPTKPPESP